jgi:hypothetical protein
VLPLEPEVVAPPVEPMDEPPAVLPDELLELAELALLELELETVLVLVLVLVLDEVVELDKVLVLDEVLATVLVLELDDALEPETVLDPPPSTGAFWKHAFAAASQWAPASQSAFVVHVTTPLLHPTHPATSATHTTRRMLPPT